MPTYTVTNQRGDVVASIGVATTTGTTYPIELIGQGISLYGPIVASTQYRLMENFANNDFLTITDPGTTVPEGLIQYRYDEKIPYIYDGTNWIRMATGFSSSSILYAMTPAASGIDFSVITNTQIFTPTIPGLKYYPTGLMLLPQTVTAVVDPALFSLGITNPDYEDILESTPIINPTTAQHIYLPLNGKMSTVELGSSVNLNITQAILSGTLLYDALLFGFITG